MDFYCCLGAAGALTAMMIKRLGYAEKYWSLLFTINGGLTGMVRIVQGFLILSLIITQFIEASTNYPQFKPIQNFFNF